MRRIVRDELSVQRIVQSPYYIILVFIDARCLFIHNGENRCFPTELGVVPSPENPTEFRRLAVSSEIR